MVTIFICIFIGIAIAWYDYQWFDGVMDYLFGAIFGGFIGLCIGFFIGLAIPTSTYKATTTHSIVTLQDGNSVSGNFFLGTGQVEGKMKYIYYYELDGFYHMAQIDYDKVKVKYTSGNSARVNIIEDKETNALINYFAIDLHDREYIIEVPEGTIKPMLILDAN